MKRKITSILCMGVLFASCAVVRPGEVGIKQRLGKLSGEVVTQGSIVYNPLTTKIIKESTRFTKDSNKVKLMAEIAIPMELDHPNIAKVY